MRRFGYDILPYLPLIIYKNNNDHQFASAPGIANVVTDAADHGAGHVNNFRTILTDGYNEYNQAISSWLHSLGLHLSNQPGYNLPLEMQAAIPYIDVPECESLGFDDQVDSYKQFSSAAILAGRNVISN